MGNISNNPIQPQIISANLVPTAQAAQEIEKAKQAASTDGKHNIIVVNSTIPDSKAIYNLSVTEMELDQVQLGQQISTGKIQGMITFMDHGGDDGVKEAQAVAPVSDDYAMSTKDAGEFAIALAVWGFGSESDEDKFGLDYSPRELKQYVTEFQKEIGAAATGSWNEESFAKAKDFIMNEYDSSETISDNQFKMFMGDMKNYYQGNITRDQAEENMDGYIYDKLNYAINAPKEPDPVGFKQFSESLKPNDLSYLALSSSGYDSEEITQLMNIITGVTPPEEAKALLLDDYYDIEEIPEVLAPGANIGKELSKVLMKEMQADALEFSGDKVTGTFDQSTYDGAQNLFGAEFSEELNTSLNQDQLRTLTNKVMTEYIAVGRGEVDENTMQSQLEAFAKELVNK